MVDPEIHGFVKPTRSSLEVSKKFTARPKEIKVSTSSTGASPGINAEGEAASTVDLAINSKQFRRTRKNCRTIDPTSPSL